jgi:hypothetical protein
MPHSCISRQSVDIKSKFFPAVHVIEKDVKVNIMPFRTLCSIEVLNFKAPVAET